MSVSWQFQSLVSSCCRIVSAAIASVAHPGVFMERRLAAIIAADIAGYSRLVGLDEAGTFSRLMQLRAELLQPMASDHGGHIVSYTGDGTLMEFPSLIRAAECAFAIQRAAAER